MKHELEKDIQRSILDFLQMQKVYCWRENTTGTMHYAKGREFFKAPDLVGKSDILGVLPDGRFLAIEVKRKGGKVSKAQEDFINSILENNGVAFVAYSIDDVQKEFTRLNIKLWYHQK